MQSINSPSGVYDKASVRFEGQNILLQLQTEIPSLSYYLTQKKCERKESLGYLCHW